MRRTMRSLFLPCALSMLLPFAVAGAGLAVRADDGIFNAAPAAKSAIDFDGKGFLIQGRREFIASGTMHYSRIPRALWRDRLLRIKRAGFNTIETYAFWNFHEMQEGKWDFTGDKDFGAYLKLIKELGMYVIVRVGPYVCAEWDSGGYPVWLRFRPGVQVRVDNAAFEGYVDKWFDKIMPIVAANQIHRGGAVILVQLENEHPLGWGKEMPNPYFTHLRDKALSLGLEVPYFFSGLHHGHDPAGDQPWDSANRTNPWMTTEFWPGWYDIYGPLNARDYRTYTRGLWKILAYGGNGYNFYMLHGGTNFDTWNDEEVASNYDYGSAVGQTGDPRPIYYAFKRGSLFARSFADILENSANSTDKYKDTAAGTNLRVTARTAPAGTLIFLDNNTNAPIASGGITVQPGEIAPLVRDYKLLPDVTLTESNAHVLGIARQGDMTTLVIYGQPHAVAGSNTPLDEQPSLKFRIAAGKRLTATQSNTTVVSASAEVQSLTFMPEIKSDAPGEYLFSVGEQKVRVVTLSPAQADRTWFVEANSKPYVVTGFDSVGEVTERGGKLRVVGERYANMQTPLGAQTGDALAWGADIKPQVLPNGNNTASLSGSSDLTNWQMRRADGEARPAYAATNWKTTDTPLQMGADGDAGAYAWYRSSAHVARDGAYTLRFASVADWMAVWINGQRVTTPALSRPGQSSKAAPRTVPVMLTAGDNTVAVLTTHYGRPKLFNYLGPIDMADPKGLSGPVVLTMGTPAQVEVANWKWRAATGLRASRLAAQLPADVDPNSGDWHTLTNASEDVFNRQRGFAWFTTTLGDIAGPSRRLHFENVDDNATVYLNGKRIGAHQGWGQPFDVDAGSAWKEGGPNQLVVLVENTENTGGIQGAAYLQSVRGEDETPVRGWQMRGGIDEAAALSGTGGAAWQTLPSGATGTGTPTYFRADFNAAPPAPLGAHPILRVTLDGLARGFIWLNGHNLGRYPEKVPIKSLYLPEPWLRKGKNTLVIFDEDGSSPTQVHIEVEKASSRTVTEYVAK